MAYSYYKKYEKHLILNTEFQFQNTDKNKIENFNKKAYISD